MATHDFIIEWPTASEFGIEITHDENKISTCALLRVRVTEIIIVLADCFGVFLDFVRWKSISVNNDEVSTRCQIGGWSVSE